MVDNWPDAVREIDYESSADDTRQPALYYDSGSNEPKPLLVVLHTWSSDYLGTLDVPHAQWCIDNDWVFVHPNFRGPNNKPEATGSELVIQDIISSVDYAREESTIDNKRIYLVGASGGGYTSLMMAGKQPGLWAGVSAWVPISDVKEWYEQGRYCEMIVSSCGGTPGTSPAVDNEYYNRSPIHFLQNAAKVPLDINAGITDGHTGSVPISHSLNAFNMLAREKDRITEEHIQFFVEKAQVPPELSGDYADATYGENSVLFRKESNNVRVTIFDGGHEIVHGAAVQWLAKQSK